MDYEKLLKSYRKKNLAKLEDFPDRVNYGLPDIKKLIPHREPFLFLDNILGIDLHQGQIIGTRYISGDDPIFEGHFPDFPVYQEHVSLYNYLLIQRLETGNDWPDGIVPLLFYSQQHHYDKGRDKTTGDSGFPGSGSPFHGCHFTGKNSNPCGPETHAGSLFRYGVNANTDG